MWKRAIIATAMLTVLATSADARASRRTVHIYADTIVIHPRAVVLPRESIVVHGGRIIRAHSYSTRAKRPIRAAAVACEMGPNFLGAAWRGKKYRPYTRSGRPRICVTGA